MTYSRHDLRNRVLSVAGMLAACVLTGTAAHARVPGTLEPTRPSEEFSERLQPLSRSLPSVPLTPEQLAPAEAEAVRFTLMGVELQGAEVLDVSYFEDLWLEHVGLEVTLADVFELVNGITRRYAEAGYALSIAVLPAQRIEGGVVTIAVVEGFIDEIHFTGDALVDEHGVDSRYIRGYAERLRASRPLRTADLERYLLLINDLPGVTARATLRASSTVPGASTMTVTLRKKSVDAQSGMNNHMVSNLDRDRGGVSLQLNGLMNTGDIWRFDGWRGLHASTYTYA